MATTTLPSGRSGGIASVALATVADEVKRALDVFDADEIGDDDTVASLQQLHDRLGEFLDRTAHTPD
jgi:hypothetical protein